MSDLLMISLLDKDMICSLLVTFPTSFFYKHMPPAKVKFFISIALLLMMNAKKYLPLVRFASSFSLKNVML